MAGPRKTQNRGNEAKKLLKRKEITFHRRAKRTQNEAALSAECGG
jgi:hypothetical protein